MSKHQTALEALRAAEVKLEHVRKTAANDQARAMSYAGINPSGPWHPTMDHAEQAVAQAEIELAAAQQAYAEADAEAVALRASMRAALESAIARADAIVDPAEPTIGSTPEAQALYEQDCATHAHTLAHNQTQRDRLESEAIKNLARATSTRDARGILARVDERLAAIVDPTEPKLGRVCPENVAALRLAMIRHAETLKQNAEQRKEVLEHFRVVARAIFAALDGLQSKRKADRLPAAKLFAAPMVRGVTIARDVLLTGDAEVLRAHLEALGVAPVEARRARLALIEIDGRRRNYAKAAERQQGIRP